MSVIRNVLRTSAHLHKSSLSIIACRKYSADVNYQEQKIKVGENHINYLKAGTGPCNVLLMPGAMGSIWTDFGPQIKGLDKNLFTVIAWDPPGYGKSVPPEREYPLDFYEKDADAALLLMKALEIPRFSLMGWSDGGISSIFLASKYPDHINKMAIWGANSHILKTEMDSYENIRDVSKWSKRMREAHGEKQLQELANKWYEAMKNIYFTNRGDICMSKLELVKCPTFILYGAKDAFVHEQHLPILQSNIENSIFHIYPEGNHNVHLKYADDFNKRVSEFLLSK